MLNNSAKNSIIIQKRLKRVRRKRHFVLRMTSLIDVFIILLVFLIKNFSTQPEINLLAQNLNLPVSTAAKLPEISTTIAATKEAILINGKFVDTIENIEKQKELLNPKIYEKLLQEKEKTLFIAQQNPEIKFFGKAIIQADKQLPYKVMKKLIYTCGQAEFGKISLHVLKKEQ